MTPILIAAIAAGGTAIASIVTGVLGYLLARRRQSGKVATTDADALWAEAGALRRAYQTDLALLREELNEAQIERSLLVQRINHLEDEIRAKDQRIENLEHENGTLTARVAELELELKRRLEAARLASKDPS